MVRLRPSSTWTRECVSTRKAATGVAVSKSWWNNQCGMVPCIRSALIFDSQSTRSRRLGHEASRRKSSWFHILRQLHSSFIVSCLLTLRMSAFVVTVQTFKPVARGRDE